MHTTGQGAKQSVPSFVGEIKQDGLRSFPIRNDMPQSARPITAPPFASSLLLNVFCLSGLEDAILNALPFRSLTLLGTLSNARVKLYDKPTSTTVT